MSDMQPLFLVEPRNGVPMTTSLLVADAFDKRHDDILKAIRNLECSSAFHLRNFAEMFYEKEIGNGAVRRFKAFEMTRDGFSFLVMGFTGKHAAQWKERFLEAFNRMEQALLGGTKKALATYGPDDQQRPSLQLKPTLRSQAMRAAVQTARLSGGAEEDVKRLFEEFCGLFAARPGRPELGNRYPLPGSLGLVEEFVAEELAVVPIDPDRPTPREAKTQAKDLYAMFCDWCRGRGIPKHDVPTLKAFGGALKHLPGVARATPKNKVFYNLIRCP